MDICVLSLNKLEDALHDHNCLTPTFISITFSSYGNLYKNYKTSLSENNGMESAGNNGNNLSENYKTSFIQVVSLSLYLHLLV